MKRFVLVLFAIGVGVISASAGGADAWALTCMTASGSSIACFAVPISGLPSVSVNPNAMLAPGEPASLGDLITYNPGINTQCDFVSYPDYSLLSTGPCSIAYSVFAIDPSSSYAISGAYVNPIFGTLEGVIGGADPDGIRPDYTAITLTANPGSSGTVPISGLINPQTTTWSYGPIYWNGNVQIGSNSCVASPSVSSASVVALTSPASDPAPSCNPPPSPQCISDLDNSVRQSVMGAEMYATFTPQQGRTLTQAKTDCDVDNFDWQQTVNVLPSPIPSLVQPAIGVPLPDTPFLDPVVGGYVYDIKCPIPGSISPSKAYRQAYPFYYYNSGPPNDCFSLLYHENGNTLDFNDVPKDPCLPDGNPALQSKWCRGTSAQLGSFLEFTTTLVGVKNGNPVPLGTHYWIWGSDFNGLSGGIPQLASNAEVPVDPGSGTGGVTILSVNGVSVQASLPSGQSCNGIFGGTFNGNVTVSANQNCAFTNGCEIKGNVTVEGGSLDLECIVDGNLIATSGSLYLGPAARVRGNTQISQASGVYIDSAAINGNLLISSSLNSSSQDTVCGAQIKGDLKAEGNFDPIEIGGTTSQGCAGNTIGGNLTVSNNIAAVAAGSNTVGGNLTVDGNTATAEVSGNTVAGNQQCQGNSAITYTTANIVKGKNQGQCATFP